MRKTSFVVAGSGYRDRRALAVVAKQCKRGDPAKLVREPSNKFDPNAVQVWIEPSPGAPGARNVMLGYVPRDLAAKLAPRIDKGELDRAVSSIVDPLADFDPIRFEVEVLT